MIDEAMTLLRACATHPIDPSPAESLNKPVYRPASYGD